MKKYIITGIAAAIAATSAMAGTAVSSKQVVAYEEPCLFRGNEWQLDAFGLGDFFPGGQNAGRPLWGGGLGINYFLNEYVGLGLEQDLYGRNSRRGNYTASSGINGITRWATIGNLFLRYPICEWNLAPYVMIGGGANYGNVPNRSAGQGFGHVGGGLEYRLTQNVGLFSDVRYLYSGVRGVTGFNQMMWRYGLRFAF
jgi:opacity protein-like surface antigen